jgi:diguanylate cyclase (GGDEF)-like protein
MDLHIATPKTIRVLLVEDDEDDAWLVRDMLSEGTSATFEVECVDRMAGARDYLVKSSADCVLLDLTLPDARWLEAPRELLSLAPDTPIVILSGLGDELLAVRAVQMGAQDYLIKGHVDGELLARSISYAIERKRGEVRSTLETMRDPLTGLPNRALFIDRVNRALVRRKPHSHPVILLCIDLADFELINDSLGRAAGDQLLIAVGKRLGELLRDRDSVARLGGDKFGVLCENIAGGHRRAQLVERISKRVGAPFVLDGQKVFVTARIGGALGALWAEEDAESLVRQAEAAVSRAKERGASSELFAGEYVHL